MTASPRLWLAIGWVALVALCVGLGILPRAKSIDRLKNDAARLSSRSFRADNGAAELARIEARLTEIRSTVEREARDIPADAAIAELIRAFTQRLDQNGMNEREITTGSTTDLGDALAAPMSVRLSGPFLGVYDAIEWLESLPRLVRIVRVKIETPRRSTQDVLDNAGRNVQAEILLTVYSDPAGNSDHADASKSVRTVEASP